jgi:hypothetical protein
MMDEQIKRQIHRAAEPQPVASGVSTQLTEADNEFFLGLYCNAVTFYQPRIERRTGVSLGSIDVRDYRRLDQDFLHDLERVKYPWFFRLLKSAAIKAGLQKWREYLQSTHEDRARGCMASYYKNAIYVSFSVDIRCHEEGVGMAAVHELSHRLWERLGGSSLFGERSVSQADHEKLWLLGEGYATYAERVWFLDLYPASVKRVVPNVPWDRKGVHFRGMKRISELVEQHGPKILLEIPKRWRSF